MVPTMKLRGLLLSLICIIAPALVRAENIVVPLKGGRSVIAYRVQSSETSPWLVFLPGSGCGIYDARPDSWFSIIGRQFVRFHRSLNGLVINKAGATPNGCNEPEFLRSALRERRIGDIREVLANVLPRNARILLVGESEGGYIAPDIALLDPRVKALILLSGGTRSWIDEEIFFVRPEERLALKEFFAREVIPNPTLDKFYRGWSYAQLVSFHTQKTYFSLRQSPKPTLVLNGARDTKTWVDGTQQDLIQLRERERKTNLEFYLLPGADHALRCGRAFNCDPAKLQAQIEALVSRFIVRLH